ncbi:MAG: UDP-glucose 4-epimerase GalE [Coriobacteriia bacterium]|nr:UDP-glucose 4-epimerase GalE [Coriobacteriia bacterium]
MRFLVTGGAGYIGSITTRALLDAGHSCVVLDTLECGHRAAIDQRAEFAHGSVGDRTVLDAVLPGCDGVMHLAGYIEVAESVADPAKYHRGNVHEPMVMLERMAAHGIDALVFSSTAAVYGEPESVPISEDAVALPVNPYGASKLEFERLLERAASAQSLRSIRFRYFNVGGAWPDGSLGEAHEPETHIIPRVLGAMNSGQERFEVFGGDYPTPDGTCVRDYIHVTDLARAHRLGLETAVRGQASGVFNLGNGRGYSNLEVVRTCAEVSGREVEIVIGARRAGDPAQLVASSQRAERGLGWRPERGGLEQIVGDAWRWHLEHPNGYR